MKRITSEKYDDFGNIIGYETEDGQIISKDTALEMARKGEVRGVISGVNENGERVLHMTSDVDDAGERKAINPMNNIHEIEWASYAKKTIF